METKRIEVVLQIDVQVNDKWDTIEEVVKEIKSNKYWWDDIAIVGYEMKQWKELK